MFAIHNFENYLTLDPIQTLQILYALPTSQNGTKKLTLIGPIDVQVALITVIALHLLTCLSLHFTSNIRHLVISHS